MWHNPDKDRDEPNPNDPKYIAAKQEADRQRGIAAIDAVVMFGVELLDGVPDDGWLGKLRYLEKRGLLDLESFDLDDPLDLEFLYKRYVAVSAQDIAYIMRTSGVREEDVEAAIRSFRG